MPKNLEMLFRHLAAENAHDMNGVLSTLHPSCLFVDEPLGLRLKGKSGAQRHYELWWSAFRTTVGAEQDGLHWISDDRLVANAVFEGTHVGDFVGLPATGREVRIPFTVFVRFENGLLAEERFRYDLLGLLRQTGQTDIDPWVKTRELFGADFGGDRSSLES